MKISRKLKENPLPKIAQPCSNSYSNTRSKKIIHFALFKLDLKCPTDTIFLKIILIIEEKLLKNMYASNNNNLACLYFPKKKCKKWLQKNFQTFPDKQKNSLEEFLLKVCKRERNKRKAQKLCKEYDLDCIPFNSYL